ncbi:thiol S-methyltransferase TMT1B-like [Saccostrea echinata]|uniref:thiol S-methyltransferase TMT1B-like n=1 Tax=Saccostrea echinata TaxID=191078 RepID=UPI002A7FDB70|nr:thiol S-methyltransferase TMT1B-like [Saccostrea echinata]
MAESDILFKTFVVRNVLPICAIIIGLYILKRNKKKVNGIVSAYLLNRFVPSANKATKREKEKLFAELFDQQRGIDSDLMILEIGAGGGANFEFYPPNSAITCLDPNRYFNEYLLENSKKYGVHVKFLKGFAEKMDDLESDIFDAVVCTFVLCTVDTTKSLQEVRRVLKPGGKFYFLEHVAAEKGSFLSCIQRLLNPVWRRILGGCQIIKDSGESVKMAGFSNTHITPFSGKFPFVFVVRPLCMGIATK